MTKNGREREGDENDEILRLAKALSERASSRATLRETTDLVKVLSERAKKRFVPQPHNVPAMRKALVSIWPLLTFVSTIPDFPPDPPGLMTSADSSRAAGERDVRGAPNE